VKFQNNRPSHKRPAPLRLTAQELAARHEEALKWRDAWRAEIKLLTECDKPAPRQKPEQTGRTPAAQFAKAMARAEFGRFYWSDGLAEQIKRAQRAKQRPKTKPT
jgi:hypothetical protein